MESSETAGERPLTKLEIQLGLIGEAFGESFGKQFFDDGTLDYLYVRGVILVRDAYLAEVARLLEEDDEPEERGQEFIPVEGLLPGVSLFSVGNRDVPRLLEKIDARLGVGRRDAGSHPVGHAGLGLPGHRAGGRAVRLAAVPGPMRRQRGWHVHLRGGHRAARGRRHRPPMARRGHRDRRTRCRSRAGRPDPGLRGARHLHRRGRPLHGARREGGGDQGLQQGRRDRRAPDRAPARRGPGQGARRHQPVGGRQHAQGPPAAGLRGLLGQLPLSQGHGAGRLGRQQLQPQAVLARGLPPGGGGRRGRCERPGPGLLQRLWPLGGRVRARARIWSMPTRPGPTTTASRRTLARNATSKAWPGGAARPSPRRSSRASSPPASPGPARTRARRPARCSPRRVRNICQG